jgi:hypothetical protein
MNVSRIRLTRPTYCFVHTCLPGQSPAGPWSDEPFVQGACHNPSHAGPTWNHTVHSADDNPGRSYEDSQEVCWHSCSKNLAADHWPQCRYSEFEDLYQKLVQTFPHAVGSMPQFPPKSVICKPHDAAAHPTYPEPLEPMLTVAG